jgi:hypothetical protein
MSIVIPFSVFFLGIETISNSSAIEETGFPLALPALSLGIITRLYFPGAIFPKLIALSSSLF